MDLIKTTNNLSKEDLSALREQFIVKYAKNKGWNSNSLTTNQMLEIIEQSEYKSPNLLKS